MDRERERRRERERERGREREREKERERERDVEREREREKERERKRDKEGWRFKSNGYKSLRGIMSHVKERGSEGYNQGWDKWTIVGEKNR